MSTIKVFLVICFVSSIFSASLVENNNKTVIIKPKQRLYNPLVCYVEIEGTMYGEPHHEEERHEPCGPEVKYCQKITAHFIAANGNETKILMKGCDTVSLLPHFAGLSCHGSGCVERVENDELYTVCCCNTETCNLSFNSLPNLYLITILIILINHIYHF